MEAAYASRLDDHLSELARHYERSGNKCKAVEYLGRTGNRMAQQGAHSEAVGYLTRSIEVLQQLPDGNDRDRQELNLQIALGRSLIVVKGWSAPEREPVLLRAQELADRVKDDSKLTETLLALAYFRLYHRESGQSRQLAQRALALADQAKAQTMIPAAHCLLGVLRFCTGELEAARRQLERADAFYSTVPYYDFEEGMYARMTVGGLISALRILGYPEVALGRVDRMLTAARRNADPYSIADALSVDAASRLFVPDESAIAQIAQELHSLAAEHGMPFYLARANFLSGWVMAARGRASEGIEQMQQAIADPNASGSAIDVMITALAAVCLKHGKVEEGLATVAGGLRELYLADYRVTEAELHRLKGELLLIQDPGSNEEAEGYFRTAIDIARRQSAKLFELRATVSLVRLMAKRGHRDQARAILTDIYNWFTEGFDTADLKEAKALLGELTS